MADKPQYQMTNEEISIDMLNLTFSEVWMMILGRMFSNFLPDDVAAANASCKCYDCSGTRTGNVCPFKKKEIEAFRIRPWQTPLSVVPQFPDFQYGITDEAAREASYTDRGSCSISVPTEFSTPCVSVEWVKDDTPQKTLGNYLDTITETKKITDPVDGSQIDQEIEIGKLYAQDVDAEVQIDFWEYNPLVLEMMTKLFRRYFVRKQNFTQCRLTSRWRNIQLSANGHFKEQTASEPLRRVSYKVSYTFEEIETYFNDSGAIESVASTLARQSDDVELLTHTARG